MAARIDYAGIIGVVLGVVTVVSSLGFPEQSATFPRLIGIALIALGTIESVRTATVGPNRAERAAAVDEAPNNPPRAALFFAGITIAYVLVLPLIGFYVTTFAFIVGLLLALGIRSIRLLVLLPLALLAIIFLTFTMQLRVPLPEGLLL